MRQPMIYGVNQNNYRLGCLKVLNDPAWQHGSLFITYTFCTFCLHSFLLFFFCAGTRANKVEPALETQQQGFQQKHSGKAVELLSYREDEEKKISIISTQRGLQILY